MTGKPFKVTRVVLSDAVKKQSEEGLYSDGLDPDNLSIKAANASPDKKPTYENTDNRTRTVGAAKKGMAEEPGGFRYEAKSKWAPGKTLKLHASRKSRFSLSNEANIGWVEDSAEVTPAQYINYLRTKPSIRLRKYKVNKATNEIIENSEQTLDPFSLNGDKTVSESSLNEKRLPGMTLGGRVRSLVARAAGKFGVLVDENGKFRCPPGTPAANQFTDMTGKNCFVFVADQIVAHAKNIADGLSSGEGIKNTAKNLYGFLSWLDNGAIPGIGRTVWRDENGKRIRNIKKWREARATQFGRTFVNGMVRAQDRLEQQDRTISELLSGLGIDAPDDKKRTNADLIEAFDKLAEMGLWDITVDGRMDETTVRTLVGQRLAAIPGFSKLSPERKRALIEADTERWYTNERAMLEAALDHFVLDPEMAKKIGNIKFETKIPGRDVMDEASTHFYFGSESGELRSQIRIDLPELMKNQEAELPQLADDERLRIDVVGAKNDAEAASTLSDFLVTVDGHSKTLAGMVEERAFARHVMKHEISHTIQGEAVAQMINKQIEEKGSVSVRFSDGKVGEYSDIKDMPADAIIALMKRPSSDINLEALAKVVSRTDVVGFLAGDYPKMYFNDKDGLQLWAVEALAELWALRDLGIIYGDDIDAALEWMDNVSDGKYAPERIKQTNAAAALKADPPEAGSRPFRDTLVKSMSEANKFRKQARKRELDSLKNWASNRETDESEVFERAAHLAKMREDLVNEFVEAEKAGVPTDSPEMRRKAEKVFELDQESNALESAWMSRFALSDGKNKSAYKKRFRSAVEEKRYAEGTLQKERMEEIRRERSVEAIKESAQEMSVDELSELIVSQSISSMEKGLSEEAKSEILEQKKAAMAVLREKVIRDGDSRSWGKARRDIQKRVDEIINPPVVDAEAEAAKFKKETRKQELKSLKDWASDSATGESEIFERAASLAKMREDLANEFMKAEKAGIPTDSPEMREKAEKVVELDQESRALESAWMSRFALDDSENSSSYRKRFRDSVESRRYEQETLPKERMVEIRKQRAIEAARETAQNMSIDELTDLVVSQGASTDDVDADKDDKSEMLAVKKAILNILKEKVIGDGDTSLWAKTQKEIQRRIKDTKTPPDTLPMKRPKKFRGDRAAETYASEHFREQMKGMTVSEVNALAELSDSSKTEIAQSLWSYQRDRALESINRRHRNLQSEAAQIDPTSREQGSVDDQVKNILVPALTAIDKSVINDDIEMEAIIPMPSAEEVGDIDSTGRIELEGLVTGDVLTAQRPVLGSAIKNPDGSDVMAGDKKMQRVVIQVPKGSKGTFPSWSFDRDERGTNSPQKLTIPPGALRVVGVRDDGTVIARVVEQKSAIETVEKFALPRPRQASTGGSNVDKGGTSRRAGKSAKRAIASKSTKDSIAPKKEESSRAKKINKTESKRTTIASRGVGSGKAEAKKPLIQPAESDIKPDEVDPRTGRPVMKTIKNMSVDELLNRRAAAYSRLLDPDFANDRNGFQGTERATLSSLDNELANRGEIVSNLPQPPEFDPNHVPGSKSRAPYKRTAGNSKSSNSAPTSGRSRAGNAGRRGTRTRTSTGTGPEGSGLSSGRGTGTERAESIRRKKSEISEKVAKRAEDSKQDIEKLEKAIKELEENGRWIGGDLGIVLGMSRDTQTETVHVTGTAPNNRTKEQLADSLPQVIEAAKIKLDRLKKEAELREFELKTKQIREEQGILDLEDIPDEIRLELEEETERLMAMSPEERQKYLQPEGWPDDVAVIHVGASELEDGVLNPAKTVGQRGAGGLESGAGNTGALNETAIDTQRAKIDGKRRRMSILSNIKDSDAENFTISNTDEKNALSEIGVIARVGDTVSISDFRDRIDATNELIEKEIERLEKPMKRLAEANMGFLSSYEFRGDIVSAGYFGRNSEKQIPHDVAEKYSEYEVAILKKKEKITDSFMYDRWRRTLRGGAHLVIGKREEDISQQFGPSTEMQILGVNKPNFSYSARTFDRDEIDKVSTAIMARAMKLHREGREITPEAVLAERLSSGREIGSERLSSGAKQRTDEILGKARDRGADIDRQEREIVPLLREAARERRLDPNTIGRIKKNLSQDNISTDDKQVIKNLVDSGKTQLEILREVSGDDSFGQRLDVLEEIATSRGDNELKQQIVDFRKYVSSMTPEQFNSEVEEAIKVFESPFDERPTVLVQDPMGVIAQGRYETVHQGRATQGGRVSGMDVAGIRVVAENQLLGMPGDTDTEISALRPASSMTLQRRHSEMREKRLKEIYGDDVEIQHNGPTIGSSGKTEALTGSRKRSSKSGDQYGRSSIILRPEVSERTLSVNGDSISDVSSSGNDIMTPGARLSNLSKDGETAAMFFDPLAVLFEARTGRKDTIASAGNNPTQRYVEGLVVGSFDLSDVESIVAEPFELRGEGIWGWGDTAMSFPGVRPEASFTNLIGAARERDRLAEKHGVDLVMDSRDMPLDEVEPFNASMTRAWVQQKIDSGQWKGVSIDQIVTGSGTTPYEALLRYNKINVENGGQEPFFDHPSNRNADERRIRENFLSMVDEELTRITGKKEEKKSGVPAGIANKASTAFIKKTRFKIKIA